MAVAFCLWTAMAILAVVPSRSWPRHLPRRHGHRCWACVLQALLPSLPHSSGRLGRSSYTVPARLALCAPCSHPGHPIAPSSPALAASCLPPPPQLQAVRRPSAVLRSVVLAHLQSMGTGLGRASHPKFALCALPGLLTLWLLHPPGPMSLHAPYIFAHRESAPFFPRHRPPARRPHCPGLSNPVLLRGWNIAATSYAHSHNQKRGRERANRSV